MAAVTAVTAVTAATAAWQQGTRQAAPELAGHQLSAGLQDDATTGEDTENIGGK